jgi:hypothetical protein
MLKLPRVARIAGVVIASVALPTAAWAGGFEVRLDTDDKPVVHGHAGLHAADGKSAGSHVRIVAPGLRIDKRGTIRVLVMNLGGQPFDFGPGNVRLTLADGTELKKVPLDEFERAYSLITREQQRAAGVDMQNRNTLSTLAQQGASGPTAATLEPVSRAPSGTTDTNDLSRRTDETLLPGGKTLGAIYEVLMPETVAPRKASGGYLVFDLPRDLAGRNADLPLTISVRAGGEEHRFAALLKRR